MAKEAIGYDLLDFKDPGTRSLIDQCAEATTSATKAKAGDLPSRVAAALLSYLRTTYGYIPSKQNVINPLDIAESGIACPNPLCVSFKGALDTYFLPTDPRNKGDLLAALSYLVRKIELNKQVAASDVLATADIRQENHYKAIVAKPPPTPHWCSVATGAGRGNQYSNKSTAVLSAEGAVCRAVRLLFPFLQLEGKPVWHHNLQKEEVIKAVGDVGVVVDGLVNSKQYSFPDWVPKVTLTVCTRLLHM